MPLPNGLKLHTQGPELSPPMLFDLKDDEGGHRHPPPFPWAEALESPSCSQSSSRHIKVTLALASVHFLGGGTW